MRVGNSLPRSHTRTLHSLISGACVRAAGCGGKRHGVRGHAVLRQPTSDPHRVQREGARGPLSCITANDTPVPRCRAPTSSPNKKATRTRPRRRASLESSAELYPGIPRRRRPGKSSEGCPTPTHGPTPPLLRFRVGFCFFPLTSYKPVSAKCNTHSHHPPRPSQHQPTARIVPVCDAASRLSDVSAVQRRPGQPPAVALRPLGVRRLRLHRGGAGRHLPCGVRDAQAGGRVRG